MTEPTNEPPKPPSPETPSYPTHPAGSEGGAPPPPPGAAYPAPPPPGNPAYPAAPPMPYAAAGAVPAAPRNGLGTAALVLGIIGLIASISVVGGIILGLVAVILGFIGRGRVKRGEATNGGACIAGIILGFLAMIASAVVLALAIWSWNFFGFTNLTDCLNKAGSDTTKQQDCQQQFEQGMSSKFSLTPSSTP